MDEPLLAKCNDARKISLAAAAGNADSTSVAGLPANQELESGDRSQGTAIPAAGGSMPQKISSSSSSPITAVIANFVGADSVNVTARCAEDRLFS